MRSLIASLTWLLISHPSNAALASAASPQEEYLELLAPFAPLYLDLFAIKKGLPEDHWDTEHCMQIFTLAGLYAFEHPRNRFQGDRRLLDLVLRGGDRFRRLQNERGDSLPVVNASSLGTPAWPTYYWLESYALVKEKLGTEREKAWREGLSLAYGAVRKRLETARLPHNMTVFHAMALYRAGQLFDREEWRSFAADFVKRTASAQDPEGFWPEHEGPTVSYNYPYLHALGLYHLFSGDSSVLPAIRKGLEFHLTFTYPDGNRVETIDGRVRFHDESHGRHVAFGLFPEGRRYARLLRANLLSRIRHHVSPDPTSAHLASNLLYFKDGPEAAIPQEQERYVRSTSKGIVRKHGPWFYCLSAYTVPKSDSPHALDRAFHVSVWHEKTGLIVGGGNSRNNPDWASFRFGKENPVTMAQSAAYASPKGDLPLDELRLDYGGPSGRIGVAVVSPSELRLTYEASNASDRLAQAQVQVHVALHEKLTFEDGSVRLPSRDDVAFTWSSGEGSLSHNGWTLRPPPGSAFRWPSIPALKGRAEGEAPLDEAAGILAMPLSGDGARKTVRILVP